MGRTIKLLLLFFAYQLAVTGVFTIGYMLWNHSTEMPSASGESYVTFLLVVQVAFTLFLSVHLVLGRYVKMNTVNVPRSNRLKVWMFSLLLIVGLSLWNNYLNDLVDLPNTMEDFFSAMMRHPLGIFATLIMAPLMEELLFRGAIQGHLMRTWKNPWWAIVVSSLLFGLVHGNPAQIPFAFTIGIGLGWVYYMTGSLLPCFFMHFVNNGAAVLIFWLTDNPDASFVDLWGMAIATGMAGLGVLFTVTAVWRIKLIMKKTPETWMVAD